MRSQIRSCRVPAFETATLESTAKQCWYISKRIVFPGTTCVNEIQKSNPYSYPRLLFEDLSGSTSWIWSTSRPAFNVTLHKTRRRRRLQLIHIVQRRKHHNSYALHNESPHLLPWLKTDITAGSAESTRRGMFERKTRAIALWLQAA
jgi:hypothetical protein